MNLTPALNIAVFLLQKYLESDKRSSTGKSGLPEGVTERVLDESYYHAMAEDIGGRIKKGEPLEDALKQIHKQQGAVLLRPAPEPVVAIGNYWLIPIAAGALVGVGLAAWAITNRK